MRLRVISVWIWTEAEEWTGKLCRLIIDSLADVTCGLVERGSEAVSEGAMMALHIGIRERYDGLWEVYHGYYIVSVGRTRVGAILRAIFDWRYWWSRI